MLLRSAPLNPSISVLDFGPGPRDAAVQQQLFAVQAERWLDHWYGGSAQRARLKYQLATRAGSADEPRRQDPFSDEDEADRYLTDDGEAIRDETTELVTLRYVRALAEERGVLYASDDLERIYLHPDGERDVETARQLDWYQHPARGALTAHLHLIDAWLPGLRTVGLLVHYCEDLEEITYQVLPPHWFHWWERPDHPTEPRLAYAVAYSEPEVRDQRGRPIPASVWTCYVRPAIPGDPPDAPTRLGDYAETGRLVRYARRGRPWSEPWPIPPPGNSEILPDPDMPGMQADGPNPLVLMGGMQGGRRIWSPLVLHAAEPLTAGMRLPIADDQSQIGEELDHGLSGALHTANLQSYGVPVFVGPGDPPRQIGPSHVVHVQDSGGSFSFASPAGRPLDHIETIHKLASLASVFEHLAADTFTFQPPSIETGPAKQLRRASLIQERARRVIHAEQPEQRRFELERLLHNWHARRMGRPKIPEDTTMEIHWGELATPVDWNLRLQEMAQELKLGISTPVDLLMERHGVDREEAERRIREREAGISDMMRQQTDISSAPDTPSGGDATMPVSEDPTRK